MSEYRKIAVVVIVLLIANIAVSTTLLLSVDNIISDDNANGSDQQRMEKHLLAVGNTTRNGSPELATGGTEDLVDIEQKHGCIVAYDSLESEGTVFKYYYQPIPGNAIYIDSSNVAVSRTVQESFKNAQVAVKTTKYEPQAFGMAISMQAPKSWEYIQGQSAGLAIAAQIAAMDPNYDLNESVILTGQVEPDGRVVSVNHISAKAKAAKSNGKTKIVVPQTSLPADVEGIEVIEVKTVSEALQYALEESNSSTNSSPTEP